MNQDKPLLEKVILPRFLYKFAIERGELTSSEVGFYIIGLIKGKVAYCYDLIEFDYYEQSSTYLETNFAKDFRLRAGLPIGLEILGNMHKHPGQMLSYSSTDKRTFTRYARDTQNRNVFIIFVLNPDKLQAYTSTENNVFKIDVEIRNLEQEERLKTFHFTIPITFQICGPKNSKIQNIRFKFISNVAHEVSKWLSRPIFINDFNEIPDNELLMNVPEIEVIPYVPIDIKLGQNHRLAYRFYLPSNARVKDLYENLIKDFKISPILGLYLGNRELDDNIKLVNLVGRIIDLKEKELPRDEISLEAIEQLAEKIDSLKKDLAEISLHNKNLKNMEAEFIKIYQFINDIEKRLEKLEGKGKNKNSKSNLDDFMRYG
ncbi:MAG: hypothetical protein ACTSO9_09385 [Candidatus Helarchaeota archaeon]